MSERWLPVLVAILGDHYEVSDQGRVRRTSTRRVLKPAITPKGYRVVSLQAWGWKQTHRVHRLVAIRFVPGYRPGLEVRHLRGVAAGDAASNLAWGTSKDNAADRDTAGNNHNKGKTHCSNHHEFTKENTRHDKDGHRICRECGRIYDRKRTRRT